MVFASLEFLLLFFPLFLIAYAVSPYKARNTVLLGASWVFYGWWSPIFLLMFIGLTWLTWIGGVALDAPATPLRRKRILLAFMITVLAGTLCWFKYANILAETVNGVLGRVGADPLPWERVVLPIGLSFIVLQAISYLVDVWHGTVKAQRSFIDFAAYKAMFGQLIAGPIIRYEWVQHDITQRRFDWVGFSKGSRRFMVGMSMKVLVADSLAPVADAVFAQSSP